MRSRRVGLLGLQTTSQRLRNGPSTHGARARGRRVGFWAPEKQSGTAPPKAKPLEQKADPALKGLRSALLKDRGKLFHESATDLDRVIAQFTTKRTDRGTRPKQSAARSPVTATENKHSGASHQTVSTHCQRQA